MDKFLKCCKMTDRLFNVAKPRLSIRTAATYEGEGKTHVTILNKDIGSGIMVDAVSALGFRLNNGMSVIGPSILFPRSILSWTITSIEDINSDSLILLTLLKPKIDIFVFGYGDQENCTPSLQNNIVQFCKTNNLPFEMLPTEDACTTFNFLNSEKRGVVAALLPITTLKLYDDDDIFKSVQASGNPFKTQLHSIM